MNASKHEVMDKPPYETVFGPGKIDLISTTPPNENLNGIVKKEVLEADLEEQDVCSVDIKSEVESEKQNRLCLSLVDPTEFVFFENVESNTQENNAQSHVQQSSSSADRQTHNTQHSLSLGRCAIRDSVVQACESPPEKREVDSTHVIIKCEPPEYGAADQIEYLKEEQSPEVLLRKNSRAECETCGEVFVTISELNTHMRSHTGVKPFECDICHIKFTNDHVAKMHIMEHMGKDQRFKCPICPRDFKRYNFLRSHIQNHPKTDLCKCRICHESFTSTDLLQSHMIIHQNKKCFSCEICNKDFRMMWQLNAHKKNHLDKKPYECQICKKGFVKPGLLKEHTLIHSGEKAFECNICKKRFSTKKSLTDHNVTHKYVECDICKKGFESKTFLWSHKNAFHSGKRTYECDTCGLTYLRRAGIVCHMRLHTGEKPFECDICKQKFLYLTTLKSHRKTHIKTDKCTKDGMDFEEAVLDTVHIKVENGYHSDSHSDHTSSNENGMVSTMKTKFKTEVQDEEVCDPLNLNQEVKLKDIKTEM